MGQFTFYFTYLVVLAKVGKVPTIPTLFLSNTANFLEFLQNHKPKNTYVALEKILDLQHEVRRHRRDLGRKVTQQQLSVKAAKRRAPISGDDIQKCKNGLPAG